MEHEAGNVKTSLSDGELQKLAAQSLHKTAKDIPGKIRGLGLDDAQQKLAIDLLTDITKTFKPAYIQGIIEAEKKRWDNANDNLPSFDYIASWSNKGFQALVRGLFAMSLPLTFAADTGTSGLYVIAAGLSGAGVSALVKLGLLTAPVNVPILAIAGGGFALGILAVGVYLRQ